VIIISRDYLLSSIDEYLQIIDRHNVPLPMSSIDFVLNINLRGTLDFVRQSLPLMTTTKAEGDDGERGLSS